jgi:hypothetical protein
MCEVMDIRYVHTMDHNDYPDTLDVGCVCAGNMEGDLGRARSRETSLKSVTKRFQRLLLRTWRTSRNGNTWLKPDGYLITVFARRGAFHVAFSSPGALENGYSPEYRNNFRSEREAQVAGLKEWFRRAIQNIL